MQDILNNSNSYADVLKKFSLKPCGGNHKTLKKIIKEYNLDETQININRSELYKKSIGKAHNTTTIPLEDILNNTHSNYKSYSLLRRLVSEGYKEYKCEICGISEWMNKPLSLHLHHKNGDHTNNHLDNLQILCPNCHAQTDTYCGKKKKKPKEVKEKQIKPKKKKEPKPKVIKMPPVSREELKSLIRTQPFLTLGKMFNVSDNAVRKWCDKYKLPRHSFLIRKISDTEWEKI